MQLVKKEFIDASKLSGREYLVSLLREAQKSALVLSETAAAYVEDSVASKRRDGYRRRLGYGFYRRPEQFHSH